MNTPILGLYTAISRHGALALKAVLNQRLKQGKEHKDRFPERMGNPSKTRPEGRLLWIHAASVGEAQSALILINALLKANPALHILVTTGTLTSAALMEKRLPDRSFHQFYPLDHPDWCAHFLDHWAPDWVLWMESELWPNMLTQIADRGIPAALVNARLSARSYKRWSSAKKSASELLSAFRIVLAQTPDDQLRFQGLGHNNVMMTDNIKYSAAPLPYDDSALTALQKAIGSRPCWVYASTHEGEEELACAVHKRAAEKIPNLLTIIVPRHPERRNDVSKTIQSQGLSSALRSQDNLPDENTAIYIADTLGELGLFYKLCPVAVIGRSFSKDGGGGHNPIEAAQLDCAVLSGPNVQYQADLFRDMQAANAVHIAKNKDDLAETIADMLTNPAKLHDYQENAQAFADNKSHLVEDVMEYLTESLILNG